MSETGHHPEVKEAIQQARLGSTIEAMNSFRDEIRWVNDERDELLALLKAIVRSHQERTGEPLSVSKRSIEYEQRLSELHSKDDKRNRSWVFWVEDDGNEQPTKAEDGKETESVSVALLHRALPDDYGKDTCVLALYSDTTVDEIMEWQERMCKGDAMALSLEIAPFSKK